jgi:hypothetical protein
MRWECSECGGFIERERAPAQCRECGTAGVIFVAAEGDPMTALPGDDNLRAVWLEAGLEQARFATQHL